MSTASILKMSHLYKCSPMKYRVDVLELIHDFLILQRFLLVCGIQKKKKGGSVPVRTANPKIVHYSQVLPAHL